MKKEDLAGRFQQIGTCATIEEVRGLIVDFQKELETDYSDHESVLTERDTLKNDNESLRQANMKLFLQVGGKKQEPNKTNPTENDDLKYENLFDEKGGLK